MVDGTGAGLETRFEVALPADRDLALLAGCWQNNNDNNDNNDNSSRGTSVKSNVRQSAGEEDTKPSNAQPAETEAALNRHPRLADQTDTQFTYNPHARIKERREERNRKLNKRRRRRRRRPREDQQKKVSPRRRRG
ncbi:hypothetical protein TESG_08307 [Trichophyton tonsurans CBS 112818]|uniref:Uncharacterized protein n=1 Tax=Trichophyton tonsurans (strain CBS 112818) TaxID=647933 RepID=F2RRN0_TRIT1|nr:hypothetical protein TESG_08307 [Trichophyton tonsurans CBS 112818]